jgi:hypothetical protein
MKKNARASWIPSAAVVGLLAASAGAQPTPTLVYDNSANPLNTYFASTREFGDQINLTGGGWIADTFRFEYFAAGLGGGETAVVRFYENNGVPIGGVDGPQAPGTLIYQSPPINLFNGNVPVTITDLLPLNIELPSSFTWTVSVSGVSGLEIFGLNLYDPPVYDPANGTTGTSLNDFWVFGESGWELRQIADLPEIDGRQTEANFGAVLTAVPEPGTVTLLALGGLALCLRRRSAAR